MSVPQSPLDWIVSLVCWVGRSNANVTRMSSEGDANKQGRSKVRRPAKGAFLNQSLFPKSTRNVEMACHVTSRAKPTKRRDLGWIQREKDRKASFSRVALE